MCVWTGNKKIDHIGKKVKWATSLVELNSSSKRGNFDIDSEKGKGQRSSSKRLSGGEVGCHTGGNKKEVVK